MVRRNQWTGPATLAEQVWTKVEKGEGCWRWASTHISTGYGSLSYGGRVVLAHRAVYELCKGPIPPGLQIDHLCRNRGCVNPDHLEAVTAKENILRGASLSAVYAKRTHCDHGHPFDEANTYYEGADRHRRCRACHRERERARQQRLRQR